MKSGSAHAVDDRGDDGREQWPGWCSAGRYVVLEQERVEDDGMEDG